MKNLLVKSLAIMSLLSAITLPVFAQQLTVSEGYIRATIPGTNVSSAYMTLKNTSDTPITLIGATSHFSDRIEIHEHVMTDSMMSMRQRDKLIIDAHSEVQLQPFGYHLMIFNLANPLVAEESASITLKFSQGDSQTIELPIQSIKKPAKDSHKHH
ncbi:copper chaperone PCu(A)C [Thalassotalea piscium]